MLTYLILSAGLVGLFLGGDWLVKGASGIAAHFGVSPMIIGLTIVGFGTSTPELLVSLTAALQGQPGIAIGNIIGSNIANILLILGLAAVIAPMVINFRPIRSDLFWMVGAALATPFVLWSGHIGLIEGVVMTTALGLYLLLSLRGAQQPDDVVTGGNLPLSIGLTLVGLAATMAGAHYLVQSATIIARTFGISEAVIGLSIVAVGTSLPELATTLMAAIRGQRDIAIGNVIGSNIFNILAILGITAIIAPIPVEPRFLSIDTPVMIAISLGLFAILAFSGRMGRITGAAMLICYALYMGFSATL